jgi:hypothetical protein
MKDATIVSGRVDVSLQKERDQDRADEPEKWQEISYFWRFDFKVSHFMFKFPFLPFKKIVRKLYKCMACFAYFAYFSSSLSWEKNRIFWWIKDFFLENDGHFVA